MIYLKRHSIYTASRSIGSYDGRCPQIRSRAGRRAAAKELYVARLGRIETDIHSAKMTYHRPRILACF